MAQAASAAPVPAYDVTVRDRIQPQTEQLLVKLVKDGRKLELDGQPGVQRQRQVPAGQDRPGPRRFPGDPAR
ncbi:hypothetical protein ACRAWD_13875 [Caulobacter segnis]